MQRILDPERLLGVAHPRDPARDARAGYVDARGARAARPVGEQAAAHRPRGPRSRCIGTADEHPHLLDAVCSRPIRHGSRSSSATARSPTPIVDAAAASCAAVLAERGVGPGDRIAVVDVGGLLSTAVILGAARLGAAAALMNVQLKPSELQELVAHAGCGAVGRRR